MGISYITIYIKIKNFNINIVLKKDKNSYVIKGDLNLMKDILNIVTGGGTGYLEAYNEKHSEEVKE